MSLWDEGNPERVFKIPRLIDSGVFTLIGEDSKTQEMLRQ